MNVFILYIFTTLISQTVSDNLKQCGCGTGRLICLKKDKTPMYLHSSFDLLWFYYVKSMRCTHAIKLFLILRLNVLLPELMTVFNPGLIGPPSYGSQGVQHRYMFHLLLHEEHTTLFGSM